ncbi:Uncharacterized protein OS=Stigmatella aurantiaca (strain DW4/3-1) GN=STAUR_0572 PE=4 SV=1 [Tuwongella immobilis]|uniref:Uncharacterized protein n=2 Tax=Tuwongella immobilis TaxID=692036 RepID=A0A6C2YJ90_9BACT|nr:Uncharacterized protein OS=Stigmatella aurantiaca (strain DW4/3-1) GN=STAUR_0572 PE=4 SV=1 [Tuwongella immobilis]VTR98044.1 Uncharacterized protein OS=Stigmatella aurantiaca (strain DW4/3-1) GN=STAUR_0572 PE=4 SV=1 [Tuwongella immobilis]
MSELEPFFSTSTSTPRSHPIVRMLHKYQSKPDFANAFVKISVGPVRLGSPQTRFVLGYLNSQNQTIEQKLQLWDATADRSLLQERVRALDEENEIRRFGLGLRAAFQQIERQHSDGFFNSVLIDFVDHSPFAKAEPIQQLRHSITVRPIPNQRHRVEDCRAMIQTVLRDRWQELLHLEYDSETAERILVGALAYYLDQRFSISIRRKLGWSS